jgi:hypothetical protein
LGRRRGRERPGSLETSVVEKRVRDIIGAQLWAKELSEVTENAKPDLAILYWSAVENKRSLETVRTSAVSPDHPRSRYDPYWGGRRGGTYDAMVVRNYTAGTLNVDLVGANTKDLAWRFCLAQTVGTDPHKTAKRAAPRAMAAFAQYPPIKTSP